MEIKDFFDKMWGNNLEDLKGFVEKTSNKEKEKKKK
jgi:hypothetical protein